MIGLPKCCAWLRRSEVESQFASATMLFLLLHCPVPYRPTSPPHSIPIYLCCNYGQRTEEHCKEDSGRRGNFLSTWSIHTRSSSAPVSTPEPPPPIQPSDTISERQVAIGGRASSRVVDSVHVCLPSPSPSDSSLLNSGVHSAAMVEHSSLNARSMWPFLFPHYTWSTGCNVLHSFLLPPICLPCPPLQLYHSIS